MAQGQPSRAPPGGLDSRRARWSSTGACWMGVHVFCAVLAWSPVRFVRFADNERADTTLGLLAECFEVLGGVPRIVLADRMGCLKAGVVANVVVPTADYVRFATHYGLRPDFCHANDPESKGIVENLVGYSKRDLMIPAQTSRGEPAGGEHRRCGVVRGGQHRGAFGDLRRPGRTARAGTPAAGSVAVAAARRSGPSRSAARSTSCPACGSARPATRCRSG